jgi:hypothetical protein
LARDSVRRKEMRVDVAADSFVGRVAGCCQILYCSSFVSLEIMPSDDEQDKSGSLGTEK